MTSFTKSYDYDQCAHSPAVPSKKLDVLTDQSDIRTFGNSMVDIVVNGQKRNNGSARSPAKQDVRDRDEE